MTGPGQLLKPRPYQDEAIRAAFDAWGRGVVRPALVLATGLGKTVIFAHVTARYVNENSRRVLVLVHRDELVRQAVDKLHSVAPHLHIGVVKANEDDTDAQVIVASVQTLARRARRDRIVNVGLVIVDECHHALARSYLDVLEHFGCFADMGAVALGVTATMKRGDGLALGQVWQEVVYERDILWGIRHGYLVDVRGITVRVEDMDMSAVRTSAGDYRAADLGSAMEDSSAPEVIAKAYAEHASDRQGIVFTPTVATAYLLAEALNSVGITARGIDGTTPLPERAALLRAYESGEIQSITNQGVLTEGFDSPATSCVVMARNTQSAPLYIQCVGRGTRPDASNPGKDLLVIDAMGVSARHSLVGISTLGGMDLVDGETLMEAKDRLDAEALASETVDAFEPKRIHRVTAEEVDLFHGSRFRWNVTHGGVRFISAGETYVVLVPEASGAYAVAAMSKKKTYTPSSWIVREVAEVSYAMVWGEEHAERVGDPILTERERAWHKKPASVKARGLASKLGVIFADDVRGGELAEKIDQVFASQRIDKALLPYLRGIGAAPNQ